MAEIKTYSDAASLARGAAEHFVKLATEAIEAHGRFSVALSGGSTPRALHTLLASDEFARHPSTSLREASLRGRTGLDWSRVHVFWGDERCVPPDQPDSNYRMARQTLLDHVPIPKSNVHRIHGELEPEQAAAEYERQLRDFFAHLKSFDLVLLGIGGDGHTASLFPGTAAIHEQKRWVVAHYVEKLGVWRITLTPAIINAAAHVIFIVSGPGKAEPLQQVLAGPYQPDTLPAQIVKPADGHLLWLVDGAAAALL